MSRWCKISLNILQQMKKNNKTKASIFKSFRSIRTNSTGTCLTPNCAEPEQHGPVMRAGAHARTPLAADSRVAPVVSWSSFRVFNRSSLNLELHQNLGLVVRVQTRSPQATEGYLRVPWEVGERNLGPLLPSPVSCLLLVYSFFFFSNCHLKDGAATERPHTSHIFTGCFSYSTFAATFSGYK